MKTIVSEEYQRFLELLVDARKSADITQTALASLLGKPQSFVSKYERSERRLDIIEFVSIAHCLQIDPHQILTEVEKIVASECVE